MSNNIYAAYILYNSLCCLLFSHQLDDDFKYFPIGYNGFGCDNFFFVLLDINTNACFILICVHTPFVVVVVAALYCMQNHFLKTAYFVFVFNFNLNYEND